MRTMGSVREFTNQPVPTDVLERIFENARFAGSGGNRQGWSVVVVESQTVRAELVRISTIGYREYIAQAMAGVVPFGASDDGRWHGAGVDLDAARATDTGTGLVASIETAPVVLIVVADLRTLAITDVDADHVSIIGGASLAFVLPYFISVTMRRLAKRKRMDNPPDGAEPGPPEFAS